MLKILYLILILSSQLLSQETGAAGTDLHHTIITEALKGRRGYSYLSELSAQGTRLSGSESSLRAIHWVRDKMISLGFDHVWLQEVIVPHWERGTIERTTITKSERLKGRKLNIASLGSSIATPIAGITGRVLEVHTFAMLDSLKEQARGKIIFFNRPFDHRYRRTFTAYSKAVKQRTEGAIRAAKAGGIAAIVRSVTSLDDNVPHVGIMRYDENTKKIPAVAIGIKDADFLSRALKEEPEMEITVKTDCRSFPPAVSYNVIGEITGAEYADEIIVTGGHLDAWDKGDGAHDDGAGCMQAMEVLDLFKRLGIRPKRTIRCVLFTDEEQKQSGAEVYAAYATSAPEKHIAAIESDRGAFTPRGFNVTADSLTFEKIRSWLHLLKPAGIEWIKSGGSGPDISKIKNAQSLIGYVPDDQRYFDFHHSDNDLLEAVNPREMQLGTAAMTLLVYLIDKNGL